MKNRTAFQEKNVLNGPGKSSYYKLKRKKLENSNKFN